jgi:hypothetical protein
MKTWHAVHHTTSYIRPGVDECWDCQLGASFVSVPVVPKRLPVDWRDRLRVCTKKLQTFNVQRVGEGMMRFVRWCVVIGESLTGVFSKDSFPCHPHDEVAICLILHYSIDLAMA